MISFFKHFFGFLEPDHRRRGAWIICLMVFNALLDFFNLAFFLPLIFVIINPELITTHAVIHSVYQYTHASTHQEFIIYVTLGILIFTVLKTFISGKITTAKAAYSFSIASALSSRAVSWFMAKGYHDYTKSDHSKELNLIVNHPVAFSNNVIIPVATILSESIVLFLIAASIAFFDIQILLFLSVVLLPLSLLYVYRRQGLNAIKNVIQEKYPRSLKYILQIIEGHAEIKSHGKEAFFSERYRRTHRELTQAFTRDHVLQTSTARITEVLTACIVCSLILYAVYMQFQYQQTILLLSVYASASFRVIPSLNRILHGLQQMNTHEYLLEEMSALNLKQVEIRQSHHSEFRSAIELRNVFVKYPNGPYVLDNVNITITKGQKIAITGKSGEGKTTMLLLLLGFIKTESGAVVIDGRIAPDGLNGIAGYVPQQPYILDASLAENIAFGIESDNIDRAKVSQILKDLDLDSLVLQLPEGMDTRIGEKGSKISGGQRQRIAIGRAMYADAEVLLLDEVTNQVNHTLELEILKALHFLSQQGKTIIMVTHKIAQDDFFDRICQLENKGLHEITFQTHT
jgi:ATP-binding cassette, subfamily B, bacterial PglK